MSTKTVLFYEKGKVLRKTFVFFCWADNDKISLKLLININ